MPSYDKGKEDVVRWIKANFEPGSTILDVGACDGKWAELLEDCRFIMDAVEVYQPYIEWYNLPEKYRSVYNLEAKHFPYLHYDLVLFGDVIEHMTVDDARICLDWAKEHSVDHMVAVPWLYSQGEYDGNKWQEHIQDDLTPEIFDERYPGYEPIVIFDDYAYFHWNKGKGVLKNGS